MNSEKRPRLPRGLHWREDSPYIWFTWRDPRGKQHRQSTQTADPQDAALFRLQFTQKEEERFEELTSPRANYGKLPLNHVADLYFKQKAIDHSAGTLARERRIFRRVDPSSRKPYRGYPNKQLPMWHRYRVELYPHIPGLGLGSGIVDEWGNELEFPSAFRQSRREGTPRGIIQIKYGGLI